MRHYREANETSSYNVMHAFLMLFDLSGGLFMIDVVYIASPKRLTRKETRHNSEHSIDILFASAVLLCRHKGDKCSL